MYIIVNTAIAKEIKNQWMEPGYHFISSTTLTALPKPIATHPDIQIHPLRNDLAICAPEVFDYYREQLPAQIRLIAGTKSLGRTYPMDCAYNVACIGEYVFCNTNHTDPKLLSYYQENHKKIIHVNQGYTRCNFCAIDDKTVFTEDIGIHNTIIANNLPIKSILLPKGEVSLDGYPYGFIGGAFGAGENALFWYGNPIACSYGKEILVYVRSTQKRMLCLGMDKPRDFGGIICFSL